MRRKKTILYDKKHFIYDPIGDEYTCPEGNKVTFGGCFDKQKKAVRIYNGIRCLDWIVKVKGNARQGEEVSGILRCYRMKASEMLMIAKMKTEQAKGIYLVRKAF